MEKEKYGQYMTPKIIADFMVSMIEHGKQANILEPSSGEGIFIDTLRHYGYSNITAYEIDGELYKKDDSSVIFESYVSAKVSEKMDVVIGNPPYIRWKNLEEELKQELQENDLWIKYLNSLNDYSAIFILKAIEELKENGELIFITPDYWMNTTQSKNLRRYMIDNGYFTDIFLFKETPIFKKVNVSLMVFRYIKSSGKLDKPKIAVRLYDDRKGLSKNTLDSLLSKTEENGIYYHIDNFCVDSPWIIANQKTLDLINRLESKCTTKYGKLITLDDCFEIGNGMVSGLDKAFQISNKTILNENEQNSIIKVLKAKDLDRYSYKNYTNYIFIKNIISEDEFVTKYPNFAYELKPYINDLLMRYNYNRQINYWEWVFLRNYDLFSTHFQKIFIPCKERISSKEHVRFSLVKGDVFPTQDVTGIIPKDSVKESIEYVCAYLNSKIVFNWIKTKGIVKGNIVEFSRTPTASIPYRKIDFSNEFEAATHDKITELVKSYLSTNDNSILNIIDECVSKLI